MAAKKMYACNPDYSKPLKLVEFDGWRGKTQMVLAATRTAMREDGTLSHELMQHLVVDTPMEDGRVFLDDRGDPWVLTWHKRAGGMAVAPVHVDCGAADGPAGSSRESAAGQVGAPCNISLGGTRMLRYTKGNEIEKNWVPHSGTTRMSYPLHPGFGPHSVFDWGGYTDPPVKAQLDLVAAEEPFFAQMQRRYPGVLEFAGGTPAVRHHDGASYVAVGHVRASARCFHHSAKGGHSVSGACARTAGDFLKSKEFVKIPWQGGTKKQYYYHNHREYAMFAYKFSAAPPHAITHISHAFLPCTFRDSGVVFPAGLALLDGAPQPPATSSRPRPQARRTLGPHDVRAQDSPERLQPPPRQRYVLTYGEANRYSRLLALTPEQLDALLLPVERLRGRAGVDGYGVCALPCGGGGGGGGGTAAGPGAAAGERG